MTDLPLDPPAAARRADWRGWRNRLAASPGFQSWSARSPFTRGRVRRDGEAMMDLVAGFVHAQVLAALVELRLLERLSDAPADAAALAAAHGIAPHRMTALLRAGMALGLLERQGALWRTSLRGAALTGVPGLAGMIAHHGTLYRDMGDPLNVLRGGETELAGVWPYVFGAGAATDPDRAARYSALMSDSMGPVAEETLAAVSLTGVRRLMDVGGGTGAFLAAAAGHTGAALTLFDLPAVAPAAAARFEAAGLADRAVIVTGSFRDDPLPDGADAITLVRVLYDHEDAVVAALLRAVYAALPPGGRVIVSEPMSGGDAPTRAGDAYFAFYCMAMGTGQARSAQEIGDLLRGAGFGGIAHRRTSRPFVTSVIEARRQT